MSASLLANLHPGFALAFVAPEAVSSLAMDSRFGPHYSSDLRRLTEVRLSGTSGAYLAGLEPIGCERE